MSSGKRRRTNMEVPASGDGMDDDSARSGSHANGNGDTTMDIDLPRLQDELAELKLRHADLKEEKERLEESVVRLTESLKDSGLATLRAKYALNLIPVVLVETNLKGEVVWVSDYWKVMMGIDDDTPAHGNGFMTFIHDEDRPVVMGKFLDFMKSGEKYGHFGIFRQWKVNRKDLLYIEGKGIVATTPDGTPYGHLTTLIDITPVKEAELELAKQNALIEQALVKAEAAAIAKTNFLASVSHEVRTPLHGMLGFLTLLEDTSLSEDQRGLVRAIRECSEGLHNLVSDVLDLSKIESGQQELSESPFDFPAWLQSAFYMWCLKANQKEISMVLDIDGVTAGPPPDADGSMSVTSKPFEHPRLASLPAHMVGDDTKLKQVLGNFLSNAIKFTEPGGSIVVSASISPVGPDSPLPEMPSTIVKPVLSRTPSTEYGPRTHWLMLTVKDTGCGIPPTQEAQSRLFRAFTQLDSGIQRKFGGTGLGLSISKSLVEMMGGTIGFDSEGIGKGSKFWFRVPVADVQATKPQSPNPPTSLASIGKPESLKDFAGLSKECPLRILVAEDNVLNQKLVIKLLNKLGYGAEDLAIANNGQEALQMVTDVNLGDSDRPYELILMDLSMPVLDGIEATRLIRQLDLTPTKLPHIVAMTANVLEHDRRKCEEAGMDGFLPKPIKVGELVATLRQYGAKV